MSALHLPLGWHARGDHAEVGSLAVDLHKGFRLIFRPSATPPPVKDDGGLDSKDGDR